MAASPAATGTGRAEAEAVVVSGHGFGPHRVRLPAVARPGGAPLRLGGTGYEGTLRLEASGQRVRVVDTLELEDYLVGVVSSECPGYWHADALRAQAVASRSYALANL